MNEFLEQFLIESRELVDQATDDLLGLEERPHDRERLDSAFRAFHTLKGAAGIVEFTAMGVALHAAEDVLSAVRAGAEPVNSALISDCLSCLDQVVQWLDAMQIDGEPPADAGPAAEAIVARFGRKAPDTGVASTVADPVARDLGAAVAGVSDDALALLLAQADLLRDASAPSSPGRTGAAGRVAVNVLRNAGRTAEADALHHALATPEADADFTLSAIESVLAGEPLTIFDDLGVVRGVAEPAARALRVDVERIDALVNLTGELTVAKNALAHAAAKAREGADVALLADMLKTQHAVLDRLVGELQRSVLNIRVLPLRHVFQRFPRLVREMVVSLGKPAHLVTEGEATEADKSIVESLFDPLLHVMRNALDHGIESAEQRAAGGKPASATIVLRAARDGEHVVVEVEDDGGGVDLAKVRQVAARRGVATLETLAALSEAEVVDLIFAPGFSTASEVTSVSGRGVGMDAVRTAVERLGGRVSIESRPGQGTHVRFLLPFTVIMSRVMTVEAGGQVFGVPMEAVIETVRIPRGEILPVGAAKAFVRRGRTIPLIDLAGALGQPQPPADPAEVNVVIASAGGQIGGLQVERLGERLDIMLKPLDGLLAGTPGVAGATLLGDGRVLIVLDLQELLR